MSEIINLIALGVICVHFLTKKNRTRWLMQQDGRKLHVHYCQKCQVLRLGRIFKEEK